MARSRKTDVPGYRQRSGLTVPRSPTEPNGLPESYPHSVTPAGPPTRADVESRLNAAADSIASRVESLQAEMGMAGDAVKALASRPIVSAVLAIAAGMLVGRILGSTRKDEDASDALTDLLSREVEAALDGGEPVDDAIHRVLAATGPLKTSASAESAGLLRWVIGTALKTAMPQVMKGFSARFMGDREEENEKSD